jgi:hypothetical protein
MQLSHGSDVPRSQVCTGIFDDKQLEDNIKMDLR